MVGKNNFQLKLVQQSNRKEKYGIRRIKLGVASVMIGTGLFFGTQLVDAESITEPLSIRSETGERLTDPVDGNNVAVEKQESDTDIVNKEKISESLEVVDSSIEDQTNRQVDDPVEEGNIRLHFSDLPEEKIGTLGLWTWGGVETESGNQPEGWPNGATLFTEEKKDDYGYYIDLPQSAEPADIGFLLLDTSGTDDESIKLTPTDQTVKLISKDMNEAWLNSAFETGTYEPIKDENILRINYYREDNNYDNLGLWAWYDIENVPSEWPVDAILFENEGKYGRYIDIPLTKGLDSSLGFLVVNKADGTKPIEDLNFADRKNHSQIFIKDEDATVYTNPYFVLENKVDPKTATPGNKNVTVTASVNRHIQSNQFALLDIKIDNPEAAEISQIIADTSVLGTSAELMISPELNRITLTATHDTPSGNYQIPLKVYDSDNGYYETLVEVTVDEHPTNLLDWDEQIIYFMLTDRFNDGDQSNNNPYDLPYESAGNQGGVYQGGDFKGVTDKLDYLADLGVTTIWVTPIVENIKYDTSGGVHGSEFYGYHGYWASDFERLNPHLGTLDEFHQLIDAAAEKNINIMVDVVLNHPGYGMREGEVIDSPVAPTPEEQAKFSDLIRKEEGLDADTQRGLSGLPDFETENHRVRQQLVDWQADWLRKATTPKGNSIYGFRVDTVKNVDNTTWQHLKNVLAEHDAGFHLIGESWGANYTNTNGDLGNGMFDSLLDFGFKEIARSFVNGDILAAENELIARNQFLTSAETLGQFLSSHDEDGFLYSIGGDINKQKIAATLQMTSKGQPVIYYGEEIGHTGANDWPIYTNRYQFDWDNVENNELHEHYTKLLSFRRDYSKVLSRGERSTIAGNNSQKWLLSKRNNDQDTVYIATSLNDESKNIELEVDSLETVVTDHYFNKTYTATQNSQGKYIVTIATPSIKDGGTLLLTTDQGNIINAKQEIINDNPIEEGMLRIHFEKLPDQPINTLGLWTWGDVETPSEQKGAWPNAATNLSQAMEDDYGYYLDIRKSGENASTIRYLINNNKGDNITGDQSIDLISPKVDEVWIDAELNVHYYRPLEKEKTIRINYLRTDGLYNDLGVWTWGSSQFPGTNWPDGLDLDKEGKYGVYVDVPLNDLVELGFLIVNERTEEKIQEQNYLFKDLENHSQIFIRDNDPKIYTNPYFVSQVKILSAEQVSLESIEVKFSSLEGIEKEDLVENLRVNTNDNQVIDVEDIIVNEEQSTVRLTGTFNANKAPFNITFDDVTVQTRTGWRLMDEINGYDGPLGAQLNEDATKAEMNLWAPSAQTVNVIVYDKDDNHQIIGKVPLVMGEKGVWNLTIDAKEDLGIDQLTNYVYHYEIVRNGQRFLVLDPYAKSMAAWNSSDTSNHPEDVASKPVGKAAFVSPATLGPDLDFAKIEGFTKREDAIIYEAHVRDFTSDPNIADELTAQFGTYAAFVERLDYLQDLGVTHIQLLPVMNYYHVNELLNHERLMEYTSSDSNYNWGYDPHNYFSLTGMYSQDPTDPSRRIEEFKHLVNEIHQRGMGVILDVVYNHTASLHILEDIEPNYYHFMTSEGVAKESFGGGRLGTTHKMSRRILVDSIKYLVDEYKVDGFRFDMMGDHDAESILEAYEEAKSLNPNIIMLGEGWVTFVGDDNHSVQPADQSWMKLTDTVASFSDEIRNELKSGFGSEGQPRFLTNGARNINQLFNNIIGRPTNFVADDPGDVIQYIAAHDNLTLYDVIAQSIKKDPKYHNEEILKRVRLGNSIILTSQGTPFIHSGQEYGRTKQFLHPDYKTTVDDGLVPNKATYMVDENNQPFDYPYFIHDSYDSSDAVNRFDWEKATNADQYADHVLTREYTRGLIAIRRSTDAFTRGTMEEIDENVTLIPISNTTLRSANNQDDLIIGYQAIASNGDIYAVFVNADMNERHIDLNEAYRHLLKANVIADGQQAGLESIANPVGVRFTENGITIDGLTTAILLIKSVEDQMVDDNQTPDKQPEQLDDTSPNKPIVDKNEDINKKESSSDIKNDQTPILVQDDEIIAKNITVSDSLADTDINEEAKLDDLRSMNEPVVHTPSAVLPNTGEQQLNRGLLAAITGLFGGLMIGFSKKKKKES